MTYITRNTSLLRVSLPILLFTLLVAAGCSKDDDPVTASKAGIFDGPASAMGNGTISAFVELDAAGSPIKLGLRIKEAALTGLPTVDSTNIVVVKYPSEAAGLPFTHSMIDWLPFGHEPFGVYDAPHFDMHFFLISETERLAITAEDTLRGWKTPDPSLVPPNFFSAPELFPTIGVYWVDIMGPEFNGVPFTHAMQYGFWDGRQVFIQSVISKAFLESKQTSSNPVQQPAAFSKSGPFPTKYNIRFDSVAREWLVWIDGFLNH